MMAEQVTGRMMEEEKEALSHRHDFSWRDAAPTSRLQLTAECDRAEQHGFSSSLSTFHFI